MLSGACSSREVAAPPPTSPLTPTTTLAVAGIGEVRFEKTPFSSWAVLPSGARMSLPELRRYVLQRHRERFGPRVEDFDRFLRDQPPDTEVRAYAIAEIDVDWDDLAPRLFDRGSPQSYEAQREFGAAARRSAAAMSDALRDQGLATRVVGDTLPLVEVTGTAAQLLHLDDDRIAYLNGAGGLRGEARQTACGSSKPGCDVEPTKFHRIDEVFTEQGLNAIGQTVAVYEHVAGEREFNCGINDDHDVFDYSPVIYTSPVTGSSDNEECGSYAHSTAVAGIIAENHDAQSVCGAIGTKILYPNKVELERFGDALTPDQEIDTYTSVCNLKATVDNYDDMIAYGTPGDVEEDPLLAAVNESYGCLQQRISCSYTWAASREGLAQDYYSRYLDMVVVKGAGNNNIADCVFDVGPQDQEACPFTLNSICVGSVQVAPTSLQRSSFSSFGNPGSDLDNNLGQTYTPLPYSDREEPDVMAVGGNGGTLPQQVCVANGDASSGFTGNAGTSFAAPVVSSLIALYRQQCEPERGARFGGEYIRAHTRTSAWENIVTAGDPVTRSAYSTPRQPQVDFEDGAGVVMADGFVGCPGPEDPTDEPIDLTGGTPLPPGEVLYLDGGSPNETFSLDAPFKVAAYGDPTQQNRVGERLLAVDVAAGLRIRASFSWSGCAAKPEPGSPSTPSAPGAIAVDFDLLLRRVRSDGTGEYVWGSQSIFDNNEGFDYTVPAGEEGTYEVWVTWPEGSTSCEGTSTEPTGFSLVFLQ
ncbi:MAG: S8 family serine peptidase [Myxococcota bacterium]